MQQEFPLLSSQHLEEQQQNGNIFLSWIDVWELTAGLAIICDMLLTTHYVSLIMLTVWKLPVLVPLAFYITFFTLEGLFLSSIATKVPQGMQSLAPGLKLL